MTPCKNVRFVPGVLTLMGAVALAGELGDPAAEFQVSKWVKGVPASIAQTKGKNIFVVEFWATWCGPCRASIPHLTKLQQKYKDKNVIVVGMTELDPRQDAAKVEAFVSEKADQMGYTIGIDDGVKTFQAYMGAFKQDGIPHTFVVDLNGAIIWDDNPADPGNKLDEVLERVVAGKFDVAAAKALKATAQVDRMLMEVADAAAQRYFNYVAGGGDLQQARRLADPFMSLAEKNPALLAAVSRTIVSAPGLKQRDFELALKMAMRAVELTGHKDPQCIDAYARALFETGKKTEAAEEIKLALTLATDDDIRKSLKETQERFEKALSTSAAAQAGGAPSNP